jgi:hypothetical protein
MARPSPLPPPVMRAFLSVSVILLQLHNAKDSSILQYPSFPVKYP